jgi:hypothetical protein
MTELLDELARSMAQQMPRRRALRVLGGLVLASTSLGRVRPAAALPRGRCSPSDLEQNEQYCKALSQAKGREHVPCIAPIGEGCTATCCPRGYYCCQFSLGGMTCCHPDFGGVCKAPGLGGDPCLGSCGRNQKKCGRQCCRPGELCRNRRCCKKCGNKACCDRLRAEKCCGDRCCKRDETCCSSAGKQMCCPKGEKCAPPILPGDIGLRPRTPPICCPDARRLERPRLCCPRGQVALDSPGFRIPPPGLSPYCCPPSMICGSGANRACVDLRNETANCGRCGNRCAAAQRCVDGACV